MIVIINYRQLCMKISSIVRFSKLIQGEENLNNTCGQCQLTCNYLHFSIYKTVLIVFYALLQLIFPLRVDSQHSCGNPLFLTHIVALDLV